jgi:chromosome segregation ATPase
MRKKTPSAKLASWTRSQSKQSSLESEVDDMQSKLRQMQRERGNLQEDLDRLRTQGTSYMNAEGDMEAQYEALQREYNALVDENKALKEGGIAAVDGEWTGGATSTSLNVMRKEYDEKIANLNEERRELVMKISAHASDLQKSETRGWQLGQQVSDLQDTVTSLNLQLARREGGELQGGPAEDDEGANEPANSSRSALGDISNAGGEERGLEDGGKQRRQQPASLLGAMGVAGESDGEAKEGECKQS